MIGAPASKAQIQLNVSTLTESQDLEHNGREDKSAKLAYVILCEQS